MIKANILRAVAFLLFTKANVIRAVDYQSAALDLVAKSSGNGEVDHWPEFCDLSSPGTTFLSCPRGAVCSFNFDDFASGICMCQTYTWGYREKNILPSDSVGQEYSCVRDPEETFWSIITLSLIICTAFDLCYKQVRMLLMMKKAGGLKYNVATSATFFGILSSFFSGAQLVFGALCYCLFNPGTALHWSDRPNQWYVDYWWLIVLCFQIMHYEILVAWIDLVKKSTSLTRKRTKVLTFAQWFIRLFNVTFQIFANLTWSFTTEALAFSAMLNAVYGWVSITLTVIGGFQLMRVLCANRSDKSHPNWEATQSIKACIIQYIPYIILMSQFYSGFWALDFVVPGYHGRYPTENWTWLFFLYFMAANFMIRIWFFYVKHGNKKTLAKVETPSKPNILFATLDKLLGNKTD
mmetsp:Transcript_34272/g.39659  ORF Transcript_34272/g.39659 Transcript_34272/m.39659 type:complete len:408 (-) Transcript_34272:289-1512(-)